MDQDITHNRDLSSALTALIDSHSIEWVFNEQPIDWRPATWQKYWHKHRLPNSHVLDELRDEHDKHGTIRRSFLFTYQEQSHSNYSSPSWHGA